MSEAFEGTARGSLGWNWLAVEWGLLVLAAPFLLFPTVKPKLTALMLGLLSLFWLVALIRRRPWPVTPFNGALLPFAAMALLGILVTLFPDLTLPKATGLILGLSIFRVVAQTRGRLLTLGGLVLATMAVWLLGMLDLQWPAKVPTLQAWLGLLPRHVMQLPGRPEAGVSPNQLAGVLVLLLPVPLAAVLAGSSGRQRLALWPLGLVGTLLWGFTLFLTQSRGGWVGGVAGLLAFLSLWGLSGRRRWQRAVGLALPLLAFLVITGLMAGLGWERMGGMLYGAAEEQVESITGPISFQGRLEIWSRAFRLIRDFSLTGLGLGTFRQAVWRLYPLFLISPDRDIAHAHNVFLQMALDVGVPGLVSYLALLMAAGWVGWQKVKAGGADRWLALGVLAGLVGFHVYGLVDTLALGSKPSFLFWWLLGLLGGMASDDGAGADGGRGAGER